MQSEGFDTLHRLSPDMAHKLARGDEMKAQWSLDSMAVPVNERLRSVFGSFELYSIYEEHWARLDIVG